MSAERPDLRVVGPGGEVAAQEVFVFAAYFDVAHDAIAEPIAGAIDRLVRLLGLDALPVYLDSEGTPQRLDAEVLSGQLELSFLGPFRTPNASLVLASEGPRAHQIGYEGKALPSPFQPDEAGCLWLSMPRETFLHKGEEVLGFAESFSEELPVAYAYASLGLAGTQRRQVQALARRHPGLDIARPSAVSADLGARAAGVYWLNVLGPRLAAAVGGEDAMRRALPPEVSIARMAGEKLVVRLTEAPELGDAQEKVQLPTHQAFARYLDRRGLLHVPRQVTYFVAEGGRTERDAQVEWHRRFLR